MNEVKLYVPFLPHYFTGIENQYNHEKVNGHLPQFFDNKISGWITIHSIGGAKADRIDKNNDETAEDNCPKGFELEYGNAMKPSVEK
tara:strand:+ start:39 stop:299 length:261 start_codon:yes stop_codon:yes gene_type:complete